MTGYIRKFLLFFFFYFLFSIHYPLLYAAPQNYGKTKIEIEEAGKALRVGEKFFYNVYWNGMHVGVGTLEVKEIITFNGRDAYRVVATAKSNEFLSSFYKVEDVVETYIDTKELYTLRFEKKQLEGRYRSDEVTVFDQQKHKGYYESLLNKKKKEFDIPPKAQDIASFFYYFRTLDVKPDSRLSFDVNADEKNWKVQMNIVGVQQLEILRKGSHKVFCVEPKAPFKGLISKRGRVWVYFTVDKDRVPVFIKIRVPFGFVVGVLERME